MSKSSMSSLVKKYIMGMSGLFLVLFLLVHCGLNCLIFLNNNGETFLHAAHFMGTNILMRILEIGLVIGFLVHIFDGLMLYFQNKNSRPIDYATSNASKNSTWYSRSMALLGTLILMFLILHTSDFWIPNRYNQFTTGEEINLYEKMKLEFSNLWVVILYVLACVSLAYHLLHGFQSAFQSLGINHHRYNQWISSVGIVFSILIPLLFALMPVAFYFGWIQ